MGYKALKTKVDDKMNRLKRTMLCVLVFLLAALLVLSCIYPPESWKYYFALPKVGERKSGEMRIHFIDVGQGDCTLIELPDGKTVLIDGGNDSSSTKKSVLRYLNALKIERIDHLIITHADSDHCGGIDEVVRFKKVLNAYLPYSSKSSDTEYAEAYTALAEEKCELHTASRTIEIRADGETPYVLSFLYPQVELEGEDEETNNNETSAVIWLDYMGVSALFAGDAPTSVEQSILLDDKLGFFEEKKVDLKSTEILKVSHHGSAESSSLDFLQYLNVRTAVVSCGKDNVYGHPDGVVLDSLKSVGAEIYRTDEKGHVTVTVKRDGTYAVKTVKS